MLLLQGHYYRGYEKRFGFTSETTFWPRSAEAHQLVRNLEKAIPGLAVHHSKLQRHVEMKMRKPVCVDSCDAPRDTDSRQFGERVFG